MVSAGDTTEIASMCTFAVGALAHLATVACELADAGHIDGPLEAFGQVVLG